MSEKPEEEFEDEEAEEAGDEAESLDVDRLMRDFDTRRKRGVRASTEPAWRKLERMLEDRRTKGLLSDFDDYEVDVPDDELPARAPRKQRKRKR